MTVNPALLDLMNNFVQSNGLLITLGLLALVIIILLLIGPTPLEVKK